MTRAQQGSHMTNIWAGSGQPPRAAARRPPTREMATLAFLGENMLSPQRLILLTTCSKKRAKTSETNELERQTSLFDKKREGEICKGQVSP